MFFSVQFWSSIWTSLSQKISLKSQNIVLWFHCLSCLLRISFFGFGKGSESRVPLMTIISVCGPMDPGFYIQGFESRASSPPVRVVGLGSLATHIIRVPSLGSRVLGPESHLWDGFMSLVLDSTKSLSSRAYLLDMSYICR